MRVDQAIKYLQEYAPDTELIIEWWDQDTITLDETIPPLTKDEWERVVYKVEKFNEYVLSDCINLIDDTALSVVKDRKNNDSVDEDLCLHSVADSDICHECLSEDSKVSERS